MLNKFTIESLTLGRSPVSVMHKISERHRQSEGQNQRESQRMRERDTHIKIDRLIS